jgi:hypothetical protein
MVPRAPSPKCCFLPMRSSHTIQLNELSKSKYAVSYIESFEARIARCHVNHLCYLGREHSRNSSSMIPHYSEVSPAQHVVSSQKNSLRCYMANSRALLCIFELAKLKDEKSCILDTSKASTTPTNTKMPFHGLT